MRHLSPKEYYLQVAKWVDVKKESTAKKWCNAVVEVIIQECFFKHTCRVPLLGVFDLELQKELTQTQTKDGITQTYVVPEHYLIKFTPCDSFINDVNGKGVTKLYRNRVKKEKITKRDVERQLRFEQEKTDEYIRQQNEIKQNIIQEGQKKRKETFKKKTAKNPIYKSKRGGGNNREKNK